jgi:superfamily II DNA helicase RecQ
MAMLELAAPTGCRWQRLARYFDERMAPCRSACDVCALKHDVADTHEHLGGGTQLDG